MSPYPTPELFRICPELRERLPWVSLARATQVERLERLESYLHAGPIWVKRDDRTSDLCGGDKARKLEFLFGDVLRRGARRVVAIGPVGSGYALAVTAFAHHFRLKPVLGFVRSSHARDVQRILEIEHGLGAELHRLDGGPRAFLRFVRSLLAARSDPDEPRWPYVVRPGKAALFATLGYVNAAHELKRQINCGILPEPECIYVPMRTGSTAAGLLLGTRLASIHSRIIGVAAVGRKRSHVLSLAQNAATALRARSRRFPLVDLHDDRFEVRNDLAGARGTAAPLVHQMGGLLRDLEGLNVDTAYGGRTLAALTADLRNGAVRGPVLLWHAPSTAILTRHPRLPVESLPRELRSLFVAR